MRRKLTKIRYKSSILLILILVFALALRLIFFSGIDSSDSLAYTKFAYNLNKGQLTLDGGHSAFRLGILFPVSILYSIFGVNEFSSNILILIISLSSIILMYKFGKLLFNEKTGLMGAFLLSFFPLDVVFSTKLMTDLPAAFFVALSVYFFLKSEKLNKSLRSNLYLIFSGLFLGIAYLTKELSLLIGLFFLTYIIYNRKFKWEYLLMALGFLIIVSFELLYFFMIAGDPLLRYHPNISAVTVITNTNNYGRGSLPLSLFHYPYIISTDILLGLFYPFIFIAIVFCILNKRKKTYSLLFWFIPLLLYLSFGSVSLTSYVPIPAAARLLSIITFPGILLLAYFLTQNENLTKKVLMPSIVILLLTTSIGYLFISDHRLPLKNERTAYAYTEKFQNVYTDNRSIKIFDYLSGYNLDDNYINFYNYEFLNPENTYALDLSQIEDSYVVINWKLINFFTARKKGIEFPDEIFNIPKDWALKKSIGEGENRIDIYYAP